MKTGITETVYSNGVSVTEVIGKDICKCVKSQWIKEKTNELISEVAKPVQPDWYPKNYRGKYSPVYGCYSEGFHVMIRGRKAWEITNSQRDEEWQYLKNKRKYDQTVCLIKAAVRSGLFTPDEVREVLIHPTGPASLN